MDGGVRPNVNVSFLKDAALTTPLTTRPKFVLMFDKPKKKNCVAANMMMVIIVSFLTLSATIVVLSCKG